MAVGIRPHAELTEGYLTPLPKQRETPELCVLKRSVSNCQKTVKKKDKSRPVCGRGGEKHLYVCVCSSEKESDVSSPTAHDLIAILQHEPCEEIGQLARLPVLAAWEPIRRGQSRVRIIMSLQAEAPETSSNSRSI